MLTLKDIQNRFKDRTPDFIGNMPCYAVLVPLVEKANGLHLLFEVRSSTMEIQPGEVCFPGGSIEPGEAPEQCALRETEEEIGVGSGNIRILAQLDTLIPNQRILYPFLGVIDAPALSSLRLNRDEVETVFAVPLSFFYKEPVKQVITYAPHLPDDFPYEDFGIMPSYPWHRARKEIYSYAWPEHRIWGITANIVKWLIDELRKSGLI